MHYEECHICSIRRESVQCIEGHICNRKLCSVRRECTVSELLLLQEEEIVFLCEEKVYSIRNVTSEVQGKKMCCTRWVTSAL